MSTQLSNKQSQSNNKIPISTWICGAVVLSMIIFCVATYMQSVNKDIEEANEKYVKAVECARKGDWENCTRAITPYVTVSKLIEGARPFTEPKTVLYLYTQAQISLLHKNYEESNKYLELIDAIQYNGEFADEIIKLKTEILPPLLEANKHAEEERKRIEIENKQAELEQIVAERASKIYIGDDEAKIRTVMGEPDEVHRTVIGSTVKKQYVYWRGSNLICIYTEDGVVTAFQD